MANLAGVSLSLDKQNISDVHAHKEDVVSALGVYFGEESPSYESRFSGYQTSEVNEERDLRVLESEMLSSLAILSSVEAAFKVDFLVRVSSRMKDPLSRRFRELHKRKKEKISLERDIFEAWKDHSTVPVTLIGNIKAAFGYRHWLAHGRYWNAHLGRRYDYYYVFSLASLVYNSFPLELPE